ncbi:hypothetical protein L1987_08119 [Smallanthus sonchifolius]|uniref:Uncharacterized protein n=1 Tax=Smallanthus sonchifolius TaxID=185202 RepID=A0ACB9JLG6_9ASTR|nr:hypothetical protein L1987_08119 [Smallanthus sonchifolius]
MAFLSFVGRVLFVSVFVFSAWQEFRFGPVVSCSEFDCGLLDFMFRFRPVDLLVANQIRNEAAYEALIDSIKSIDW